MQLLVLNANTSEAMTEALGTRARAVARPGTVVTATRPAWGPESVESWYDAYISAAGMLDRLVTWNGPLDAVVMAGFGDVGREGLREAVTAPVVDITEAAVMAAQLVGHRYAVVTTLRRAQPMIEASLRAAGLDARCATIRSLEISVGAVAADPDLLVGRFRDEVAGAVAAGADVICLGSAALAPFTELLAAAVEAPVVDGVAAAVALGEACHHLGLRTSPIGSWSRPLDKPRPGWPVSTAAATDR